MRQLTINSICRPEQELAQLELLCKQLYEATDTNNRSKAEAALVAFSTSSDCLPKCQLLLERGDVSPSNVLLHAFLTNTGHVL